jgi:lipopolysaccharide transport system ATP-binding protein
MSDIAIQVDHLSKQYHIGVARPRYQSLRDDVMRTLDPRQWFESSNQPDGTIWALKDVSFEVKHGEVIGIIGRNGAGKSTLLKILSRITDPTEGEVLLNGRVGSLLEVGTGFHPELTGRENIYLNGAILGMTRHEIDYKFDEIVDFAETERFIDTPAKHFSSGMYMRLAFAVAAHLEPEILLVDEVLAVGDAAFQKKCLGKMGEVAKAGRTVLFVSHNMRAVRQMCQNAILLNAGKVVALGSSHDIVERYLQDVPDGESFSNLQETIQKLPRDLAFRLESIILIQDGEEVTRSIVNGSPLEIEVRYEVLQKTTGLRVLFDLMDYEETLLVRSFHDEDNDGIPTMLPGHYSSKALIPADLLAPTRYQLRILATIFNSRMCVPYPGISIPLDVEATGRTNRAYLGEPFRARLAPAIMWKTTLMNGR